MVSTPQAKRAPEGFVWTEVGTIPNDWILLTVDALVSNGILEKPLDGNHGNLHPKKSDFVTDGIPFVMANNLVNGKLDLSSCNCISTEQASKLQKGFSVTGDILLTHKGTIGSTAIVDKVSTPYIMLTPQVTFYRVKDIKKLDSRYLRYFFDSDVFQGILKALSGGGTRAYIGITKQLNLPIVLPPTKAEQSAVAEVLSDTDALIESLEKLVAKRHAIKQGTMRKLLTGEQRLPGFSEEWTTKRLADLGEVTGSGVDKKKRPDEQPIRLVNYLDVFHRDFIYSRELDHWVTATSAQAQRCSVKKGDLFFTPSSEMRYDIALSAVAMEDIPDAAYSYHLVRLRMFEDWDLAFRAYVFKTDKFINQAETICEGSGKRYVISLTKFRAMTIYYPPVREEQSAIASILWDMDSEIAKLQGQLDKLRLVKQGMMQELLTGKSRLLTN